MDIFTTFQRKRVRCIIKIKLVPLSSCNYKFSEALLIDYVGTNPVYTSIKNNYSNCRRDGSAKKYANKGGIQMITNTTGIPTSHTHTCTYHTFQHSHVPKSWSCRGRVWCRDARCICYHLYSTLVCVLFGTAIPTSFCNYYKLFFYTC